MLLRYKNKKVEFSSVSFNTTTINEVLTGDDSAYITDLDAFIVATGEWKDMAQAFKDHDIITDNYNTRFFEPPTEKDRVRGYTEF